MNQTLVATAEQAPSEAEVAFERLYRSSRDDVYAYVAGLLRDRAAAEEVTATAFERAYRKRSRFDAEPRRAAGLALRDRPQRRARRAAPARPPGRARGASPSTPPRTPPPRTSSRASAGSRSAPPSSRLAAGERELIALKFFAGLDNAEIADVLEISESNAGTRLHRAMTKLREACDEAV